MKTDHDKGMLIGDRLAYLDFDMHNAEVGELLAAEAAGNPYRVRIFLGTNTRYFMMDPLANPEGMGFESYSENPDAMFDALLKFQRWSRFNLLQDQQLGLPEKWVIAPDFQNYYDAAWFGCEVRYIPGEVPDTRPDFADCPERLMENGPIEPASGLMLKAERFYERFVERARTETYLGRPIEVGAPWCTLGCDGLMTICCSLFGPDFVCGSMAAEPERLQTLFEFVNECLIGRMMHYRKQFGIPVPQDYFGCADDSIAMISNPMFRRAVLPHHKRLYDTFGTETGRAIHLCGDSTRHFVTLRDEVGIYSFDTGFPVDFGKIRRELGPDVAISGGPHVEFLMSATPGEIREEVRRIFETGILEGRKFTLREGNNLAPHTPRENCEALYFAGREMGRYTDSAPLMTPDALRPGSRRVS